MSKKVIILIITILILLFLIWKDNKSREIYGNQLFTFPQCSSFIQSGDKAHYETGLHQIAGNGLVEGRDDVYTLGNGYFVQCFCPSNGEGIQTNWTPSETGEWGPQWNLEENFYSYENVSYNCNLVSPTPTVKPETPLAASAPPEWQSACFYLRNNPECLTKEEVFPQEGDKYGPNK